MTKKLLRLYVIVSGFVIDVASETLRDLEDERLTTLLATKTMFENIKQRPILLLRLLVVAEDVKYRLPIVH